MASYTYVDNSNVFIEGQRLSAVKKGLSPSLADAMETHVVDHDWNLDYGRLHQLICGEEGEIGAARLWGSPPPGDTFWEMVKSKGFDVKTFEKGASGKEKKVDVAIAHRMTKDAYTVIQKADDEIALVSGDKDFVPVVTDLVAEGFKVEVVFWDHAAGELRSAASSFYSLNRWHDYLTWSQA